MTERRGNYRCRDFMTPARKYQEIRRGITDKVLYEIAGIVLDRMGLDKAITREELAVRVFGTFTTTTDRKVRLAIKELFKKHGIPIGAISAQAGYFIITSDFERDIVKNDHVKRRDEENEFIRLLDNIDLDEEHQPPEPENQMGLFK